MPGPKHVLDALAKHRLLLVQDAALPNIVRILTGETVRGSWWSHPRGKLVFSVLSELAEHRDVLFTKLVHGKVTLVHRSLWPAFLAVANERGDRRLAGLTPASRRLLDTVEREGAMTTSGAAVKELELRLFVHTREVHTDSGRHAVLAEAWPVWARRMRCRADRSLPRAKRTIEGAVAALGAPPCSLAWLATAKGKRS